MSDRHFLWPTNSDWYRHQSRRIFTSIDNIDKRSKRMKKQEEAAQKVMNMWHSSVPCGEALAEAIDKAGYELVEKPKPLRDFWGYVYDWIKTQAGYDQHRLFKMDGIGLVSEPSDERRKNIMNRLTFIDCCAILKYILDDHGISFCFFISEYDKWARGFGLSEELQAVNQIIPGQLMAKIR